MKRADLRFDLDGVPLDDEDGRTTAILRFRTTQGIVVALPESVDVTIAWADITSAVADLVSGRIELRIAQAASARHPWLGSARRLVGAWTDRAVLDAPPRRE